MDRTRIRKGARGLFSSAVDEATDLATEQALIQYVKFVENGRTVTLFFGLEGLTAQDANTLFETHRDSLAWIFDGDMEEMHKHHMAMGTDGCGSMIGCRSGVTALFKQHNPRLISVWCHAHRWALVVKHAAEAVDELTDWQLMLRDAHNYFVKSVKKKKGLNQAQLEQGEKILNMIRDIETRWLSKGMVVQRFRAIILPLWGIVGSGNSTLNSLL
jgi:hypothetical protein